MNSGILATLIHDCPYRFAGVDVLADIFFVIALATYVVFVPLFLARFIWFKRQAYDEITNNPAELTFASCVPIAFMTITGDVASIVSTAWWGGHPWTIVAYVMWWFIQFANIVQLVFVFALLIRRHSLPDRAMPLSIIIPAVSVSTIAVTGASVTVYAEGLSARLAVPVIIVCFYWAGIGIILGLILMSYLFNSLMADGWPAPAMVPGLFIFVGPMGQSSAALQLLSSSADLYHRFGDYNAGTFITAESAKALSAACTLVALLLNGVGVLFVIFGIFGMVECAFRRKLKWTPTWNAIVFPNGTLATSILLFSQSMDSPAYRVIFVIYLLVLVLFYIVNLLFTGLGIYKGELLVVRDDPRVKKALEQQREQKEQ